MTLAGGALFGFLPALVVVSFASTIGATLAFLVSRFLLRDWVQARFGERLRAINAGVEKEGAFYLFTLRLVPVFPFFVINLAMGLTPHAHPHLLLGQPARDAGRDGGLRQCRHPARPDPEPLGNSFPRPPLLLRPARRLSPDRQKGSGLREIPPRPPGLPKPKKFDYNLVVIGAGSAGLVASYIAAAVKAKVALIEKDRMGGDCLNTGCVPSKALIRSARMLSYFRRAGEFGIRRAEVDFDFAEVMERVQRVIGKVEPHDSVERYTSLGVDVMQGAAKITSPWTVEVNGRTLTTRAIVIATGASPWCRRSRGSTGSTI